MTPAVVALAAVALIAAGFMLMFIRKQESAVDPQPFPRRLFQTWKSKTDIPVQYQVWQASWKTHNPSWEFVLWDDADNRAFVKEQFPWFLETYDSYPKEIYRADVVRYCYLYTYGGVYADMDFECLKPFEPLLKEFDHKANILLGSMKTSRPDRHHSVPNAILISKPGNPFWLELLRECQARARAKTSTLVEAYTGPIVLKHTAYGWKSWFHRNWKIHCFKPEVFYPISWSTQLAERQAALGESPTDLTHRVKQRYPSSYAATYWSHSW